MLIELNERVNEMLEYISAPEAARKWGISERRVQKLCEEKPADKRKRVENRK
ncbi:MAG: hypothetical protein K2L82_00425 [Lachnospiraceae bacterium]|nr:hypothetical protein [Lachnospiraceae bacterium]